MLQCRLSMEANVIVDVVVQLSESLTNIAVAKKKTLNSIKVEMILINSKNVPNRLLTH